MKNYDTIIDLYDRSVVASISDKHISSRLAIRTLRKVLDSQPVIKGGLILHSDQGTQYTSKTFVKFCESENITQSTSKACSPYDNALMERYFNTLKNECTNLYEFATEEALYQRVENLHMLTIIMCDYTVLMVIKHLMKPVGAALINDIF